MRQPNRSEGCGCGIKCTVTVIQVEAGLDEQSPESQQSLDFRAEPLGEAVAEINRLRGGPRIIIDADLADLPVTGVLQKGGTESLARSLAAAFDLLLVETPERTFRLTRKQSPR